MWIDWVKFENSLLTLILRSMLVDPFKDMDWAAVLSAYTIDIEEHHDFFVVTVSRLCYYCGLSVQTFFLYYLHVSLTLVYWQPSRQSLSRRLEERTVEYGN